jgi:excisionase family DNA binding protein
MDPNTVVRRPAVDSPSPITDGRSYLLAELQSQLRPMLTADEASELLGIRKPQVYALARDGTLPSVRVGRLVRFNRDILLDWIANGGSRHPAGPQ